jgi:adenosyl cobinamide kinase/adenosyl cobinamide phosphate guanylyltransferase
MVKSVLIIGGARSGKSRFALTLAEPYSNKTLVATLEPKDEEMKARIKKHQRQRGKDWKVIEEPVRLAEAVRRAVAKSDCVVVDCITLWLSNLLLAGKTESEIGAEIKKLCKTVTRPKALVVVVSNEVGQGIVPADPLTRQFRDLQGKANQMLAAKTGEVYLMAAGIALKIKGQI